MFTADASVVWGHFFHEAAETLLAKVKPHLSPKEPEQGFIYWMDHLMVLGTFTGHPGE